MITNMKTTLACLLLLHAGLSSAQTAPTPPLATRAEYHACLEKADALATNRKALQARKTEYDAAVKQLEEDIAAHVAAGIALEAKKKGAVEAYNNNGAALNTRRTDLTASADQFSKDIAAHNLQGKEHSTQCSGMKLARDDREAVDKQWASRAPK